MSVETVTCRGGCGRELDPELHPTGTCEDCERREYNRNREPPGWRA